MAVTRVQPRYAYETGEEVVVRLEGIEVYDVEAGRVRCAGALPAWTIGAVAARTATDGVAAYLLSFRDADAACLCIAPEHAIDGTA